MDLDKYDKILNENPLESLERSIKTKQAWQKYRNNFKSGIKRRQRIDKLTGNKEDKFNFKEETKRDYTLSSSGEDIRIVYIDYHDTIVCRLYKDNKYLGSAELYFDKDYPDYIHIEHIFKEKDTINFTNILIPLLKRDWSEKYKGVILLPLNKKLTSFYESLGFEPYITSDMGDTYYRKKW